MKKIFVLLLILCAILLTVFGILFSIKIKKKNGDSSEFVSDFKSESIINIEDKVYGCEIFRDNNLTEITLQDPPSVNGIKITWENGKQKIFFQNIENTFNKIITPENSFLNLVVRILDSIKSISLSKINSDGKYTTFKGKIDKYDFEFTSDDKLYLQELKIPSKNSKINFNYKNS